jgi:SAM-dependent methyltransferase
MERVLSDSERSKLLDGDDSRFYSSPRFVQHVDDRFRERLTALYREVLSPGDDVLDAMSSWVSHLPDDLELGAVVGHGLNEAELDENPALDSWVVQDFNERQALPFDDGSMDAVLVAVSVQYLQYPEAVFTEFARVLRPGGAVVVSFSNRMFPQKAIRAWRDRGMDGRADLVRSYLDGTGAFEEATVHAETEPGTDPFYAVVARFR